MEITYIGHACFEVASSSGVRVLFDPYETGAFGGAITLKPVDRKVDVVLVSHDHADHNDVAGLPGHPVALRAPGEARGITFDAVDTHHDESHGSQRGSNRIFHFRCDGLHVAHLGDLGHPLTDAQAAMLKPLDLVFVPVGGTFTVDPKGARKVVAQLAPRVVVPMHFKVPKVAFPLRPVEEFTKGFEKVVTPGASSFSMSADSLPEGQTVYLLKPLRG